jgi:hypothetical protein
MPIQVPADALGDHVLAVEAFYNALVETHDGIIDMREVTFIRPYAVIALLNAAHYHHNRTGTPLRLQHMAERVHQYLERVDLFKIGGDLITTDATLTTHFDRTQPNPKLLELTRVSGTEDVFSVITRAERIFSYWLNVRNLRGLMSVLSEVCANAYQHSDSSGIVMIQTHEAKTRGQVRIRMAIGDTGIGVRASLERRFGSLSDDTLGYLTEAMNGRTSRHSGRGGLGLRVVQQTVGEGGGYMWIRSGDAAILSEGLGQAEGHRGLAHVPGTQVAVDFHAPLRG